MSIGETIFRWVVIDDVDTFPHISQQALRRPMESYSHITRFLFIGSSKDDLIPALQSRCIHIPMNNINILSYGGNILKCIDMPHPEQITHEIWMWLINIAGNNISDLIRLLKLIRNMNVTLGEEITLANIQILCSAPFYLDFLPLLNAMSMNDSCQAITSLLMIWKRGYTYEDILESFQVINNLFGNSDLKNNILIHRFLINAWISYCKGNTSILALQNVIYKTINDQ
jgi:replication factor C subunit 2/4